MRLHYFREQSLITIPNIAIVLVLLTLAALGLIYSQSIFLSWDEGAYLMAGSLARQGYQPYTEFFVNIPPFGLSIIRLGVTLFGEGLHVRYVMLLCSLIGVGSLFWLMKSQAVHSPIWTGLLAMVFLFGYPTYFFQATLITMDVPAVSWALLSLALLEYYRSQRSSRWLLLSGIGYGLSLTSKIFIVFLPVIVGLQLLQIVFFDEKRSPRHGSTYSRLVKMGLIWLVGVGGVLLFFLLIFDPAELYQKVVAFHLADRADRVASGESWVQKNGEKLLEALTVYLPLLIGALVGLGAVGRRGLARVWVWPVWFVLAAIFLFFHVPVRTHHFIMLLPPLAALSSVAITHLPYRFKKPAFWLSPATLLVLVGLTLLNFRVGVLAWPREADFEDDTGQLSSVEFVRRTTGPADCIVVDDVRAALLAERPIPPNLSEPSHSRVAAGLLSTEEVIAAAIERDCPVLIMGPRFSNLPNFAQTAASVYALKLLFANPDGSHTVTVYAVKTDSRAEPAQIFNLSLDNQVILKGADLTPTPWRPGQTVSISTYWQAQQKMAQDYKIFMHLKNEAGQTVQTLDHYPFQSDDDYLTTYIMPNPIYWQDGHPPDASYYPATGLLPTRLWLPGQTLKETVQLTLPADLARGVYTLEVGMYDEATLAPLVVQGEPPAGGQAGVTLATVEVIE